MELFKRFVANIFVICSIFDQITCEDSSWKEDHVPVPMKYPMKADSFANYLEFVNTLPDAFGNIRGTTTADIIQRGAEVAYNTSSFKAYFCQIGYQFKGFGGNMILCSRLNTVIGNRFEYGDKKCIKNNCDLKLHLEPGELEDEPPEDDDILTNVIEGSEPDPSTVNTSTLFDCYNDKIVCGVSICTKHGVHGFGQDDYACATSSGGNMVQCEECLPEKSCSSYQYACGMVSIVPDEGEETEGVICCLNTELNVVLVPVSDQTHKKPTYGAAQINETIEKYFNDSGRPLAGIHFDEEGDDLVYSVCPPDYFVQGFNGETLLCTKDVQKIDVSYDNVNGNQCLQHLCFPDSPETGCINSSSNSPKYFVCSNGYVTKKVDLSVQIACQDGWIPNEENVLSNQGLSCDADSSCPGNSKPCGVIQHETARDQVPGLVCCDRASTSEALKAYMNERKHEFEYFYKRIAMERQTLTVENDTNEESMLFNEKIQDYMYPDDILQKYFVPLYNRKMWAYHNINDFNFPTTLIMCPNNTYVRGIQTAPSYGDAYQILCSEMAPLMEKYEQKLFNTEHICPQLVLRPGFHLAACGPNTMHLQYEFCTDGYYYLYSVTQGMANKCVQNPCGENTAVCGITNYKYGHELLVICCEHRQPEPLNLPELLGPDGNLNDEAITFVLKRLAKEYQMENNGRRGTDEQVIDYHRQKHYLSRALFAATLDDYRSAPVNEAITSGSTIPDALKAASGQNGYEYWLIDTRYDMYYNQPEALRAVLCPTNMFVRGYAPPNRVLCSEEVPIFGKVYTTILGAESTCITSGSTGLHDSFSCSLRSLMPSNNQDAYFCVRGFYGRNSPTYDTDPLCTNGYQCSNKVNGSKICGLVTVSTNPSANWFKVICCNEV